MNTFTKTLASTIRVSYMVLPPKLLKLYYEKLSFYSCTVPNFEQYTLARFIQEGYFEKHINRMRNYYHTRRDIVVNAITNSPLRDFVTISKEDAGLHFLMKVKTDIPDDKFVSRLREEGIKLKSLSNYYNHSPKAEGHTFIMNYSAVEQENIAEAMQRIYKLIQEG